MVELLRSQFVGMHEARKHLAKLVEDLRTEGHEIVLTRQGKPAAVIIDVEKYLEVQQALREFSDPRYVRSLLEAREEIRSGQGIPAAEVFAKKGV